jgi:hypothetical protein
MASAIPEIAFIERQFVCLGEPMLVRFFAPEQAPTSEYKCRWEIHWPERLRKSYTCGVDAIQALMLAMRIVHTELRLSDPYKQGHLTYFDSADLDLPATFYGDEE